VSDLVAFLLARIAEDARLAKLCSEAFTEPWAVVDRGSSARVVSDAPRFREVVALSQEDDEVPLLAYGDIWLGDRIEHVARWSPARVLAECEAKRRIIEWHKSWPVLAETRPELVSATDDDPMHVSLRMTQQIAWLTHQEYVERFGEEPPSAPILRMLAQPYREHPDFDPAWALL